MSERRSMLCGSWAVDPQHRRSVVCEDGRPWTGCACPCHVDPARGGDPENLPPEVAGWDRMRDALADALEQEAP